MSHNPILEELYAARDEILAEYEGDLEAYIRSAGERMKASGHPIANVQQRSVRRGGKAKPPLWPRKANGHRPTLDNASGLTSRLTHAVRARLVGHDVATVAGCGWSHPLTSGAVLW